MKKLITIIMALVLAAPIATAQSASNKSLNKALKKEYKKEDYMRQSIKLAVENIRNGGGPFGAVIVKDGKVVATG